jgi:hypothetical protein
MLAGALEVEMLAYFSEGPEYNYRFYYANNVSQDPLGNPKRKV